MPICRAFLPFYPSSGCLSVQCFQHHVCSLMAAAGKGTMGMNDYTIDERHRTLGATREYALDLSGIGEGESPPRRRQRPRKRRVCPACGGYLARDNHDRSGLCRPCQKCGDEPLSEETWAIVFEHLAAALCASWEDVA
jgi:hypothetical protein